MGGGEVVLVPRSAHRERGPPARIAGETAEQLLRRFELLAVSVGETCPRRVGPPPDLEAPDTLGRPEAKPGYPEARAPGIARLEVEEPLERGGGTATVGLAFPAVKEHQAGRTRPEIVGRTLRRRPPSWRPDGCPLRDRARRRRGHRLRLRPHGSRAAAAPAPRSPARRLVLHDRSVPQKARPPHLHG